MSNQDNSALFVQGASVVLNNLVTGQSEMMTSDGFGEFQSNLIALESNAYSISISHPDYDTVTSAMTAPKPVPLLSVDTSTVPSSSYFREMHATLNWDDPVGKNCYIIKVKVVQTQEGETLYKLLKSSDPSIFNSNAELGNESWLYLIVLDDASFNGESKSMNLKFTVNQAFSEEYHFELYTCSADFFKYLVSIEKMSDTKDNPFSEPVLIHSNINNGLGIFGGLSKSVVIM